MRPSLSLVTALPDCRPAIGGAYWHLTNQVTRKLFLQQGRESLQFDGLMIA
ncbi:MAG: hypothetical protein WAW42_18700 [Candidatus Competibacteraceae bacterium]|jgi:hypothetical protein